MTVVKVVPARAPGTSESEESFVNCRRAQLGYDMIDDAERTYVGHPVEAFIAAVKEIVGLRDTHEAVLSFSAGGRELPHHVEGLLVDG